MLTVEQLAGISSNPDPVVYDLAGDLKALVPEMRKAGITTKRKVAAFLGTIVQETDRLKTLEEYGGKSYWMYLDRNSGRAGEWRYHGRGYIMLTWSDNYRRAGDAIGVDLVGSPDLLKENKRVAAKAACWFWSANNINPYAERGEFYAVSAIVNTGSPRGTPNHYPDRKYFYDRAMRILPDGFDLGERPGEGHEEEQQVTSETRRVVIPQTFTSKPTAARVRDEIRQKVRLPPEAGATIKEASRGSGSEIEGPWRVNIAHRFEIVSVAERVRDEIRREVAMDGEKTVVLHKPRSPEKKRQPDAPPASQPARPKTEKDRLIEKAEEADRFGLRMLGTPYGDGWEEGSWPALSSLYSTISRHDNPEWYKQRECICAGFINVLRFEAADLPSLGWNMDDGWPGGTAALWRHYAFAPGTRKYPPVANTPRHWLVVSPYLGAALRLQGHVGKADGKGKLLEARVPVLSNNRTEAEVDRALRAGGARGNERIVPLEVWLGSGT